MNVVLPVLGRSPHLPIIRQSEASECGLACLAMVARYHGYETSLASLRRTYNTSLHGMTLKTVANVAEAMGFTVRPLKVPIEIINQTRMPAIIHWDMNHFVVLKLVSRNKVIVHDPSSGIKTYRMEEFSKHFTGIVLELQPSTKFEEQSEPLRLRLNDLWSSVTGLKRGLIQLLFLAFFLQVHVLLSPIYLQTVMDEVLIRLNNELLLILAWGFGGFALINMLTYVLRGYLVVHIGANLSFQFASNLFNHLLQLPIDFFEKRHMGDVLSRFGSITPIKQLLTEGLIGSVLDGIMAITTLVMMAIYSPTLAFISLGMWLTYFSLRMLMYRYLRDREEEVLVTSARENSTFMESVRGITSLKLFGGEIERRQLWQNQYADSINASASLQKIKVWFEAVTMGLTALEIVVIIFVAAKMIMATEFTVGMIFAFMAYRASFASKASALVEHVIEFRMLTLHLERISDIVYTEAEDTQENGILESQHPVIGEIKLKNISYKYSFDSPKVLDNLSLTIHAGESVAIIGPTGCGKTTLFKILTTLFSPDEGEMLIDGQSIKQTGLTSYRKQIGVVMQEDGLMSGTLAENISFFDPEMNMEKIYEAAKDACIYDDIIALPMKFECQIGDMGTALSGGQKQRLTIARALYRKPRILFMDEGTSNLDVVTEKKINKTISALGITRIIIAHRPETIKSVDRILECVGGKLVEVNG